MKTERKSTTGEVGRRPLLAKIKSKVACFPRSGAEERRRFPGPSVIHPFCLLIGQILPAAPPHGQTRPASMTTGCPDCGDWLELPAGNTIIRTRKYYQNKHTWATFYKTIAKLQGITASNMDNYYVGLTGPLQSSGE